MPYNIPIEQAKAAYPEYTFITALTPSEQKAAFHVIDNSSRKPLCLKLISPDYPIERLDREIQALQQISHPNIVSFVDYTRSIVCGTQRHHIIEEFIDGNDLSVFLTPGKRWQVNITAHFFAAICDGLMAIHKLGIVHRDLKPSNIRIRTDGQPVIIDFGVARHLTKPDLTRFSQGAKFGTPLYFSPEQCCGTREDIDHRTDLFAIGILIFQALTGRHPFDLGTSMTLQDLYGAICTSEAYLQFPEFASITRNFQLLVTRLLEKERARRPQDAAQVATLLRKIGGAS